MPLLAFVTDIHHGPDEGTKRGHAALPLLDRFAQYVDCVRPDAVVDLGDRVFLRDRNSDLALLHDVADAFRAMDAPRAHCMGNHDLMHLSREDNADVLGVDAESHVLRLDDWDLVVWQAETRGYWDGTNALPQEDLSWLEQALFANGQRPCVVVSHFALCGHNLRGNPYFEGREAMSRYTTGGRIRTMLRDCGRVAACVAGHLHQNAWAMADGIPHLALQSLTETFTTGDEPAGAWGVLDMDEGLRWRVGGRDPLRLDMPLRTGL